MIPAKLLDKITHGDSMQLSKQLPDKSIDLIFTDPVYDNMEHYQWLSQEGYRVLKPDRAALISFGIGALDDASDAMRHGKRHLEYRWEFVWYQSNNQGQRADPGWCKWSPIRWYEKGRSKPNKVVQDLRNVPIPVSNLTNSNVPDWKIHKWAKPPKLISYYLEAFSKPGDVVWDPFSGSGTVALVCKMLGRHYVAFEIDKRTVTKSRRRLREQQPPLFTLDSENDTVYEQATLAI